MSATPIRFGDTRPPDRYVVRITTAEERMRKREEATK